MFTADRSLPASADLRAASSLARLAWLKVTEPDRATCAGGLAPVAGVEPLGLLEQAAVMSASMATAQTATVRDLVLRIIVDRPSEGVGPGRSFSCGRGTPVCGGPRAALGVTARPGSLACSCWLATSPGPGGGTPGSS